jgi:hypothetical protein
MLWYMSTLSNQTYLKHVNGKNWLSLVNGKSNNYKLFLFYAYSMVSKNKQILHDLSETYHFTFLEWHNLKSFRRKNMLKSCFMCVKSGWHQLSSVRASEDWIFCPGMLPQNLGLSPFIPSFGIIQLDRTIAWLMRSIWYTSWYLKS